MFNIQVQRSEILACVRMSTRVVPARSTLPILSYLKLEAKDGTLSVTGTNNDASIRASTQRVEIKGTGSVMIAADKLNEILGSVTSETVCISEDGSSIVITGEGSRFKLASVSGEFPASRVIIEPHLRIKTTGAVIRRMFSQVVTAAAKFEARFTSMGIMIDAHSDDSWTAFCADGRRLHVATGDGVRFKTNATPQNGEKPNECTIPASVSAHVMACVGEDQEVEVMAGAGSVEIIAENIHIASGLIMSDILPYKDILTASPSMYTLTIKTDDLKSALTQARILTNEATKGVRVSLAKDGMSVSAFRSEGEAVVSLIGDYQGDPIVIGVHPDYILEAIKGIEASVVSLHLSSPTKPMKMTTDGFTAVFMLINVEKM